MVFDKQNPINVNFIHLLSPVLAKKKYESFIFYKNTDFVNF